MLVPYLARKILPADPKDRHLRVVPNPAPREQNPVSPRTMAIGLLVAVGVGAGVYGIAKAAGGKAAPKPKKGPGGGGEVIIPPGDEPTRGQTKPKGNYAGGTTPSGQPWSWNNKREFPTEASLGNALADLGYYVGDWDAPGFTMVQRIPMLKTREFQVEYNMVVDKIAHAWPKIDVDSVDIGNGQLGGLMGNETIGALSQALAEVAAQKAKGGPSHWAYIVDNARKQP